MGSGLCAACSKAQAKPRQKAVWERELTSREDALKAARFAACCYFGLAALDFIIAGFGEPFLYITAIVIMVCATLVWSVHSRAAAVVLLGLFLFDIIVLAINRFSSDQKQPSYVPFLLLMFQGQVTIQAVRATFRLHKEYRLMPGPRHERAAECVRQSGVLPAGEPTLPFVADALHAPPPHPLTTSASHGTPAEGREPFTSPSLVQKPGITTAKRRLTSWYATRFNQHGMVDGDRCPLWNPMAAIAWSLLFTPAMGSALVYLNWMRLGRVKRAHTAALWFWGSLAWLLFCTVAPPAVYPPLWAYVLFVGLWICLLAYPQHLSFAKRFPGSRYPKSSWNRVLAAGVGGALLLALVHAPFARLYRQRDAGVVAALANGKPAPVDGSNHLFSAEEITQYYRSRILEIGVQWKVSHGFWIFKSEKAKGGQGSGLMLVNSKEVGLIVTNWHVVDSPQEIVEESYRCGVRQDSSQQYNAASCVARAKPPLDLALLLVKLGDDWQPDVVPVQSLANLHQGEGVVAIGNALGEGISTTSGLISHFDPMGADGLCFIRTSTPISPGNSGGPLFTAKGGFYAGITTASSSAEHAQNYNVAIPAEYVLDPDNWNFFGEESGTVAKQLLEVAHANKHP